MQTEFPFQQEMNYLNPISSNGMVVNSSSSSGSIPSIPSDSPTNYPTSDPHVLGKVWNNGGFLCVSQG